MALEDIQVSRRKTIAVGFDQRPQSGVGFDPFGALGVEIRTAGQIPAGERHDIAGRSKPLGTGANLLRGQFAWAGFGWTAVKDAGAAAAATLLSMPGGCPFPRFHQCDLLLVGRCSAQNIPRAVPMPLLDFGKRPGVTLSAGQIASRLINGEIIFGAR